MSELESLVAPAVARLRIVIGALIAGVLVFWAIAIFMVQAGSFGMNESPQVVFRLTLPLLVLLCLTGFVSFQRSRNSHLQRSSAILSGHQLVGAYATRTIVGAAVGEAVALFSGVAYLITGDVVMILGLVAALVAMASFFPSEDRLREFLVATGRPI